MAITTERYQGTLTTSAVAVLTAATGDVLTLAKGLITNTSTTTPYSYTMYDDTAGTGAATGNMVQNAIMLSPKETKVLPLSALAMVTGGKLWVQASANSVLNISISYSRTAQ
jgi:hypothetical protein